MIQRNIHKSLLSFTGRHVRLDFPQTLADEQDAVDEHTISRAVDFKVAKQHIGTEEGDDLVDAVVGLIVRGHVGVGDVGGERGEGVCGAARASPERKDGEVACQVTIVSRIASTALVDADEVQLTACREVCAYQSRGHPGPRGRWSGMPGCPSVEHYITSQKQSHTGILK